MDLPQAFLNKMKDLLGAEYDAWENSFSAPRVHGLRANPLKIRASELKELLSIELDPIPWCENGFYYPENARPGKFPFHDAGLFYIQEPSAMLPAVLLKPEPGMRVLDLCAAPGGKTTQLAGAMKNEGLLIANEPYPARAKVLAQNIERLGIKNAVVTCVMPDQLAERFSNFFDRIMVDAPCSGEGMFRKDEDTRGEWSEDTVVHCAQRQWEILRCAVKMLRPGGRLVYSTCTFSPEENERIIARVLAEYNLRIVPVEISGISHGRPEWADGNPALAGTCRIWPHRAGGEGHFAALLEKEGESPRENIDMPAETAVIPEYDSFCRDVLSFRPAGGIFPVRDQLYLMPIAPQELQGIRVIRAGLHLGTCKKKRFEPSHAFALGIHTDCAQRSYELEEHEILRYLKGETLVVSARPGWILVTIHGYPIGWGKVSGGILKNHYPKGLRRMGNEE